MKQNPIRLRVRCKELLIDYLVILAYLLVLFTVATVFYMLAFGGISRMPELQAQFIATATSVVPVIILFSVLDWRGGSVGKQKAGLVIRYKTRVFWRSLARNLVKFLPWQLAHIGVIGGVYSDWEAVWGFVLIYSAMIFAIVLLAMGLLRRDKRHLGDMVGGTQVIVAD